MGGKKVGVMAGSPVDCQMGIDFLNTKGLEAVPYPVAPSARALMEYQILPQEERTEYIRKIIVQALGNGMDKMMIYCNTLCSVVDMESLSVEMSIPLITPMMIYRGYAGQYGVLGVMAGSNQSLAKIESVVQEENDNCVVLGFSNQLLVEAIESGVAPGRIMEQFNLVTIIEYFRKAGAEAVILGCTHFPCLYEQMSACTEIPILNPAEQMYKRLVR